MIGGEFDICCADTCCVSSATIRNTDCISSRIAWISGSFSRCSNLLVRLASSVTVVESVDTLSVIDSIPARIWEIVVASVPVDALSDPVLGVLSRADGLAAYPGCIVAMDWAGVVHALVEAGGRFLVSVEKLIDAA